MRLLSEICRRSIFICCGLSLVLMSCGERGTKEADTTGPKDPKLEKLRLLPGFKAEHLYSPSDHEQGSWVAMTFDDKGRLITADQYGALYRMQIPAIGSDTIAPKLEKLRIHTEGVADSIIQMGYAQGLLYAFNSLYVMVNHWGDANFEKTSGLYRLQDTDNDDQYDKITLLKHLEGAGEHGPHSIVLGPDGKSLYVIAGNHTDLPEMDAYRQPPVWKDDNLFPQIKDPRGHANDRGAPGGWIAKIDPEGKHWELFASGFRNPFDLAFNEAGDMFTYDSDMEWDLGMPWYRPTRICFVPSGAEFGWRTGNGKWSPAYPDNLPPVLNIGQGSPTNVVYGTPSNFPEKYKHSLYAFDWSFGIVYALQLQPDGATYTANKEEFLSGIPLPLTDGVFGPDGALYFMTGGRRLGSDLYRVFYDGDATGEAANTAVAQTEAAKIRKHLETLQVDGAKDPQQVVAEVWPYLGHADRFVRYAARVALEHVPVNAWAGRTLDEKAPEILIQASLALAREGGTHYRDGLLKSLLEVDENALDMTQKSDYLRALEVIFYRDGKPGASLSEEYIQKLSSQFPTQNDILNQQLSKVLVFLGDPTIPAKLLDVLESNKEESFSTMDNTATNSADLIMRNPQYGLDIANTLKNMPPAQHTFYGTVLAAASEGWTPALRERYFKWFYKAFSYKAGLSYIGFVDKARKMALSHVPKAQYEHYNTISGDSLLTSSGIDIAQANQPKGPGKNWQEEDIDSLLAGGLTNRNFEQGQNMFRAATCVACHTMQGEGGTAGPNLTNLGTRFSARDILEAIIDPNAVISDQYASVVFTLKNGQSVVGRLVSEDGEQYNISQNPYDPNQMRSIAKADVVSREPSTISAMPPGTINRLSADEIRDLLAYLMSGAKPDAMEYYKGSSK